MWVEAKVEALLNCLITSKEEFDEEMGQLNKVLQEAIDKFVPMAKVTPYMRRWWSKELASMRKEVAKLSR